MRIHWRQTCLALSILVLAGCGTVHRRANERGMAYRALSPAFQKLVDSGQIERGMDTNAVYIAWGPPSEVTQPPGPPSGLLLWTYYGNRTVLTPTWRYIPDPRGYSTLEPTTLHESQRAAEAQVRFENGLVVDWQRFSR